MSKSIQVVFVHGDGFISETIENVEKYIGQAKDEFIPSHCGIIIDGKFAEAIAMGFVLQDFNKYPKEITRIVEITIDNPVLIATGDAKFLELTGRPYGYRALVNGFLYTLTGKTSEGDEEATGDCSEDDTRILRAYGLDILDGIPADDITPYLLFEAVKKIGKLVENV